MVLSMTVSKGFVLRQLDVTNAFLQEELDELVFMKQPPSYEDKNLPTYVCRFKKAIYDLKEAPRTWYACLSNFLICIGFQNSIIAASLFVCNIYEYKVWILVYVDDLIVTGDNSRVVENIISLICARFRC